MYGVLMIPAEKTAQMLQRTRKGILWFPLLFRERLLSKRRQVPHLQRYVVYRSRKVSCYAEYINALCR